MTRNYSPDIDFAVFEISERFNRAVGAGDAARALKMLTDLQDFVQQKAGDFVTDAGKKPAGTVDPAHVGTASRLAGGVSLRHSSIH